ncbi:response regulator transcription factor [Parasulfuritortus cantonensis]|uniref:Response regulator transcription factor n=1 Tax=Parasulfuritortus cantonensis TaxID=2528202 RepID=A0A4R1BEJ9_9PROT|nr:response regulator transcription factor [Parasulfuritortus cantonensis]TCJ15549.1 response regulator transcription factor [Parasulfuritortus cantonensis]
MRSGFILEDLPESQAWLGQALATSFPGIAIETADTLGEARARLADAPGPDIALIDLGLPDGSGVEIIELIQRRFPATLCVVASIYDDDGHVFPALRAGARGYLLKDQPIDRIVEALSGIAAGQPPLSPAIARRMLAFFRPEVAQAADSALTGRETEVLRLIAKGMTQAETARLLGISQHTVAGYVKELYRKLNVSSRAEAALRARDMGLV